MTCGGLVILTKQALAHSVGVSEPFAVDGILKSVAHDARLRRFCESVARLPIEHATAEAKSGFALKIAGKNGEAHLLEQIEVISVTLPQAVANIRPDHSSHITSSIPRRIIGTP
jgi:hypothetical protein